MSEIQTKRCARCRQEVPCDQFSPNKRNRDGLNNYCRPCAAAIVRQTRKRRAQGIPPRPSRLQREKDAATRALLDALRDAEEPPRRPILPPVENPIPDRLPAACDALARHKSEGWTRDLMEQIKRAHGLAEWELRECINRVMDSPGYKPGCKIVVKEEREK